MLSDRDIRVLCLSGAMVPFCEEQLQPASYDVRLGEGFLTRDFRESYREIKYQETHCRARHWLDPGECALGTTMERIRVPHDHVARIEGKSSLGRKFLAVHVTAGFIDPGFEGNITLELVNHGPFHLTLEAGMLIAQVSFYKLSSPCERPYGTPELNSHYQGQTGTTPPRSGTCLRVMFANETRSDWLALLSLLVALSVTLVILES